MIYGKKNYIVMGISALIILIGLVLMAGGKSVDGISFNPEVFSPMRIKVAPVICLIGFFLMLYGILADPIKSGKQE